MHSSSKKMDKTLKEDHHHHKPMINPNPTSCFFCILKEQDPTIRKSRLTFFFKTLANKTQDNIQDHQELVLILSGIWSIAMAHPDDDKLPSAGVFECMSELIKKGLEDADWLLKDQNIYVPYYAAHVIGSYTMNNVGFAIKAVNSGVLSPLLTLLRGKMTWVEQRVAVRALGHLASYEETFQAVAIFKKEIVNLAMGIASTCLKNVYTKFVAVKERGKRLKYHENLLSRGVGGFEMENRKAEEWASQLQSWSLNLLKCFAVKEKCLDLICNKRFLRDLSEMWGGLVNHTSPGGVGVIRVLCYNKYGRKCVAGSRNVVRSLCDLSRTSDDWQYMGIDCLLLLLSDEDTRYEVLGSAALCLVDLVELRRVGGRSNNVGEAIARLLLSDSNKRSRKVMKIKNGDEVHDVQRALEEVWDLKVGRRKREQNMCEEKLEEKRVMANLMKQQGNHSFNQGKIEEAMATYTKALEFCPLRYKKERTMLYSNRGQCKLLVGEIDGAISDTTRALCLSNPPNSHAKSLWRRSQAYDVKGLAKESLMDCIMFINCCFKSESGVKKDVVKIIPYYAVRMITKQMDSTCLFSKYNETQKTQQQKQMQKEQLHTRRIAHYLEESCDG